MHVALSIMKTNLLLLSHLSGMPGLHMLVNVDAFCYWAAICFLCNIRARWKSLMGRNEDSLLPLKKVSRSCVAFIQITRKTLGAATLLIILFHLHSSSCPCSFNQNTHLLGTISDDPSVNHIPRSTSFPLSFCFFSSFCL